MPTAPQSIRPVAADLARSSAPTSAQLDYVPAIDGLRGIAIAMVLLFHLRPARLPGGLLGVDLFFVISGFVVAASVQRHFQEDLPALLSRFYARRIRRILPALLTVLVCGTIVTTLFIPWAWRLFPASANIALLAGVGASNLLLSSLDGGYATMLLEYTPFFHTWSLGVEEQFYLLFPVLYWATMRTKRPSAPFVTFALLTASSFALAVALRPSAPALAFYSMPTRYWELGAGTLLFLSIERWQPLLRWIGPAGRALLLVAAPALLLATALYSRTPGWLPGEAAAVAAAVMLVMSACTSPVAARLLTFGPLLLTGRSSYSLYLWHVPVIVLFKGTVGVDGIVLGSAALAVTFGLGLLSYAFIEQPFRRLGVAGRGDRRLLFAGAAAGVAATTGAILLFTASPPPVTLSRVWGGDERLYAASRFHPCGDDGLAAHLAGDYNLSTGSCVGDGAKPRLFVAGDSHAAAYAGMLLRLSVDLGLDGRLIAMAGCPLPPLERPDADRCSAWSRRTLQYLTASAKAGDVIFLSSLYVARTPYQWGPADVAAAPVTDAQRRSAYAQAHAALSRLTATGAAVILEAPEPVFKASPYRCSEWFNRRNRICAGGFTVARNEQVAVRAAPLAAMGELAQALPRLTVWDPFPILCPAASPSCSAFRDGRAVFLDDNHIAPAGTDLLYGPLRTTLLHSLRGSADKTADVRALPAR